ncbi:flagellar motor switch protein FliN [Candidatus Aerophobetes bacterium]|uniref:Flagellar motor switch protein FliN n=1 Tax=Aerophobetes bacterium TaxID=2030807 RepID=A0A497E3G6_UNCAE|nr:MAG: flagellar motor switch protein FliN [Candidatus Aerophobetes bacterium]
MRAEDKRTEKIPPESKKKENEKKVNVQPVQFSPLKNSSKEGKKEASKDNLQLLLDVPLQITAELGRATMKIEDVLKLGPGSIIELNKLAGEPVDLLVNGKLIAQGEVVVVDENFGVRITSILGPEARIKKLQ